MLDILETVESWIIQGRKIALATVVDTWGSAPRGIGAKMAVTNDIAMIGSVSGGCVENAVIQEAVESLADGKPRLLHYGVSDDTAWNVGLACGGKISVFIEPLDLQWWKIAAEAIRENKPITTITILTGDSAGQKMLLCDNTEILYSTLTPDKEIFLNENIAASRRITINEFDVLVDIYAPHPRLVIIGGVHVAIPLQFFATHLGFDVVLVDPRRAFASPERFPGIKQIFHSYPDKALPQIGLNADTYIAVLTHDPKIDDLALKTALPSAAPYIGVLSSKRTHQKRLERLKNAGLAQSLLDRIRTPIGIEIGAKSPEEIALCIMTEIVAVRNGAIQ